MINELNNLIMQAMKEHNTTRTETLRAIKTAFMNWETSKEHAGQEMTEADEIQILKKMVKQREESADMYQLAHRQDLVDKEIEEANIIKGFLPAEIDDYIIEDAVKWLINPENPNCFDASKKNMGKIIGDIKRQYPGVDGKRLAQIAQKYLD
jgi:uncharacterized protein YqeY